MGTKFNPFTSNFDVVLDKASEITNVPAGTISATTVQAAIDELDTEKQPTGNYLTALTGEVTASGPGSAVATVDNAAVIAKVLTGYTSGAGSISSADSLLTSIQKLDGNTTAASLLATSSQSTGLKTGAILSIGTGGAGVATSFTIALGVGLIVDNTVIPATISEISWSAKTDVAVTNIGTQPLTFVAIDSGGNVIQQATDFTDVQHRQYIVIGSVIHTNLTTVTAVNQSQHLAISPQSQLNDLMQAIAGFNYSGNLFSANGANLNINKSAGIIFKQGSGYAVSANNPNSATTGALTAASFRYNNQTGAASGILTAIDPNNYDNAGTTTAVPVNKFTTQRIFLFSSNLLAIQRGQTVYNSLAEAKAAIQTETFVVNSSISPNGILRGFLIVKEGTTALNNATSAFFLEAPKFGGTAGVGGLSVSTLQNAYDNSISPEILTDSTRGALTIRRGSAADTDLVIEGMNNASSVTFSVTGNGVVQSAALTASQIVLTDASKNLVSSASLSVALGGTNSTAALNNNRVMQSSSGAIVEAAAITASRALISDANGIPTHATTTSTEIGYVNGVTSAIQTQLDAKQAKLRTIVSVSSNVTLTTNAIHLVSTAAARSLTLPSPVSGTEIIIKDVTGSANVNNITVVRFGSETIEGVAASYTMDQTYQSLTFIADGTNWWLV